MYYVICLDLVCVNFVCDLCQDVVTFHSAYTFQITRFYPKKNWPKSYQELFATFKFHKSMCIYLLNPGLGQETRGQLLELMNIGFNVLL